MNTAYDRHAQFYLDFVDKGLAAEEGHVRLLVATIVSCLGDRLANARVLDLCCGEGYLGRMLVQHGAGEVVGIDLSAALITAARQRADSTRLSYRVDDAHALRSLSDGACDVVVSQMAMMDVEDHRKLFSAVRRVLVVGGPFVFSLLHPCFEGRPFHVRDAPPYVLDDDGQPVAFAVRRYATEGFFDSGGIGYGDAWVRITASSRRT